MVIDSKTVKAAARAEYIKFATLFLGVLISLPLGPRAAWCAPAEVPRALREAWLRFHETELCQGVDAVFSLRKDTMEVWCLVEDEKSYGKFLELIEPLRASYTVAVYVTRLNPEKKSPEDKDPPPSLWNNAEIREYLQDPFQRNSGSAGGFTVRPPPGEHDTEVFLKQRIMMFAEQTLEWERKMNRYAGDLPELAEAAFGSSAEPALSSRAAAACLAHAQGVEKLAERLADNLARALPKAGKRSRASEDPPSARRPAPPVENAIQLANGAHSIARRIYNFIHPQNHTVGLVDLREPSLLESLRSLRRMVGDFQRSASRVGDAKGP